MADSEILCTPSNPEKTPLWCVTVFEIVIHAVYDDSATAEEQTWEKRCFARQVRFHHVDKH